MSNQLLNSKFLIRASRAVVRGRGPRYFVRRFKFFLMSMARRSAVRARLSAQGIDLAQQVLEANPRLAGFFIWPFVNAGFSVEDRFTFALGHHQIVNDQFGWLDIRPDSAVEVLDLSYLVPGLEVRVEAAPWFLREGCLNFSLFREDQRLMTICFTLAKGQAGGPQALVGAIQGIQADDAVEVYKSVAAACHDLRPRDMLFKIFRLFIATLDVDRILCISDDCRASNHPFFGDEKRDRFQMSYNDLWIEQGGVVTDDGFYAVSSAIEERNILDVPQKKRGRYKRRMDMFAAIGDHFDAMKMDRWGRCALPDSVTQNRKTSTDNLP